MKAIAVEESNHIHMARCIGNRVFCKNTISIKSTKRSSGEMVGGASVLGLEVTVRG